jgi:hypothetical protein
VTESVTISEEPVGREKATSCAEKTLLSESDKVSLTATKLAAWAVV